MSGALKYLGLGAAGLLLAGAALFVVFYVILPRRVGREYEAFVAAHGAGRSAAALTDDEFFWAATTVDLYDLDAPAAKNRVPVFSISFGKTSKGGVFAVIGPADRKKVRDLLAVGIKNGSVNIMWTQVPPFGRVLLDVRFKNGVIAGTERGSLD